jgi:hypothetical protein
MTGRSYRATAGLLRRLSAHDEVAAAMQLRQIDPHSDNIHMGTEESDETSRFGQAQTPPGFSGGVISRGFVRELP